MVQRSLCEGKFRDQLAPRNPRKSQTGLIKVEHVVCQNPCKPYTIQKRTCMGEIMQSLRLIYGGRNRGKLCVCLCLSLFSHGFSRFFGGQGPWIFAREGFPKIPSKYSLYPPNLSPVDFFCFEPRICLKKTRAELVQKFLTLCKTISFSGCLRTSGPNQPLFCTAVV